MVMVMVIVVLVAFRLVVVMSAIRAMDVFLLGHARYSGT
jgi:hypothetical protein